MTIFAELIDSDNQLEIIVYVIEDDVSVFNNKFNIIIMCS